MSADPKAAWGLLIIFASTGVASGVVWWWRESTHPAPTAAKSRLAPAILEPSEHDRAVPVSGAKVVPNEILGTAERRAAPFAPGLRLLSSLCRGPWEEHRAEIRDETTGDARRYAIGDLLPHGSLLVGLSTGSAEVMVADRTLVRLHEDGRLETVEDFRTADEARPLVAVPDRDQAYRAGAMETLELTRGDDPEVAQAAVDRLIDAGEPVLEVLVPRVDSLAPTAGHELCFPSGSERCFAPSCEGDLVVALLERLTGQSFGDVSQGPTSSHREIHRAWLRWWGVE